MLWKEESTHHRKSTRVAVTEKIYELNKYIIIISGHIIYKWLSWECWIIKLILLCYMKIIGKLYLFQFRIVYVNILIRENNEN